MLKPARVFWFVLRKGKFREVAKGTDGVLRSQVFPGLWLDSEALLKMNRYRLLRALRQGLASAEHAAFVLRLE